MTTNKYVHGKVTETHHVQRNSENLEKKKKKEIKGKKKKKMECSKKTEL